MEYIGEGAGRAGNPVDLQLSRDDVELLLGILKQVREQRRDAYDEAAKVVEAVKNPESMQEAVMYTLLDWGLDAYDAPLAEVDYLIRVLERQAGIEYSEF